MFFLPLQCICTQLSLRSWCKFKGANLALVCAHLFLEAPLCWCPPSTHFVTFSDLIRSRLSTAPCIKHVSVWVSQCSSVICFKIKAELGLFLSEISLQDILYSEQSVFSFITEPELVKQLETLLLISEGISLCVHSQFALLRMKWSPHPLQQHQHSPSLSKYLCI